MKRLGSLDDADVTLVDVLLSRVLFLFELYSTFIGNRRAWSWLRESTAGSSTNRNRGS